MIIKVPHSAWKQYNQEELCAEFDLSAKELAECAQKGLVLQPPSRLKGPPFNELDHLRLRTYKRCVQSGYGLEEVLDLIGRLHRRTALIRTLILAKAYATEKLEELKGRMAGGDTLELINLRCDTDILQSYIDDLTRLQSDGHGDVPADSTESADAPAPPVKRRVSTRQAPSELAQQRPPSPPKDTGGPTIRAPYPKAPVKKRAPQAATPPSALKGRVKPKRSYPRTYGSLEDESRQLWKRATPGGYLGWAIPLLLVLAIIGGYLYLMPPSEGLLSGFNSPETPLEEESISTKTAINNLPSSIQHEEVPPAPSTATKAAKNKPQPDESTPSAKVSLTEKAASDLEKIMAASGETAAATGGSPRVIRINELVVFYDTQTRILRAKIELLKNLVANAPPVISGRIFMVLKPMDDMNSNGIITLPRIPLSANKMADFSNYGVAFSLEDEKTIYVKTQLLRPPAKQEHLTLYIFDSQQNLLFRETTSIEVKQTD